MRDITPRRPAMIQGQMHRRIGRSARDPLWVTALAVEGNTAQDSAVLVSCDLACPTDGLIRTVREQVTARLPALPADRVILLGTHTHTSLVIDDGFYEYPGGDVMSPSDCRAWVADRAVEAVVEAWESRRPRLLGRAFGHAVVGHNRHAVYADGHAEMYGQTNREDFAHFGGYEDHSLDMLFTWEPNGQLAGIALVIPCPSQVDEHLEEFSADYWHEVRTILRERVGQHLQVLPMCGAGGDQSPHFLLYGRQEEEMRQRRGVTERQEIAQRVAAAVERALEHPRPNAEAASSKIAHRLRQLTLTPRRVSKAERDWAKAAYEKSAAQGDTRSWWPQRLHRVVEQYDGVIQAEPVPAEIHVLRLGDLALATNPFELFLDYSLQIKACSPAAQTSVVQLAGHGWYLPSARAVAGGGYGAMPAVSVAGPEGGRELVEATLDLMRDLFPASR